MTSQARARFGTFGGVFTPCVLTILGVIMFLRFGQVVGRSGIGQALLVVALAKLITTLTALSLSGIATNTQVRGGGAYYLISRSLGIEFGGAIGLVFFLSQAVSVAMYVVGFTEAALATWPGLGPPRVVGSIVNVLVFASVYGGAGWTIRLQYGILGVLVLSILSFVAGALGHFDPGLVQANWAAADGGWGHFLPMFALFFPAATGIMAGANMSGDLKDPARSIPRGTLLAIGVTAVIYAGFALLLGGSSERASLESDTMVVERVAWFGPAITAGIFAATLSSALGSMMGAPRILQALARDRVFPLLNLFARGAGKNAEPRRATVLSFLLAEAGILLGDLDAIAPVITMFFMVTYGGLNLATVAEGRSANPSWRPTFRWQHWTTALTGAVLCTGAMLLINPLWAVVAMVVMGLLYWYLVRQNLEASWGDVTSGGAMERARRSLLALEQEQYHPKNWRPVVIALGVVREERRRMAVFARWLSGRHGLLILGQVLVSDDENFLERHARHRRTIRKFAADNFLDAFPAVTIAPELDLGLQSLLQCTGIGALRPNLVVLGWSSDPEREASFVQLIRSCKQMELSIGILRLPEEEAAEDIWEVPEGPIDVWWLGQSNGELMVLLAHLLRQNDGWRDHVIRLRRMLPSEKGQEETRQHLQELVARARIRAVCDVVIGDDFAATVVRESGNAALTILGFRAPEEDDQGFLATLDRVSTGLPRVLLVSSAGDMGLND